MNCLTCQILRGELNPPGGIILQTKYWSCDHAYDIPLPGFLFLKTNRHVESIASLNENEANEFGSVLLKITKAMDKLQLLRIRTEITSNLFRCDPPKIAPQVVFEYQPSRPSACAS